MTPQILLETLILAWNATDPHKRKAFLEQCVTENFHYTDPHRTQPVSNRQEMLDFLTLFRERLEHNVNILKLETHHHVFRLHWQLKRESDSHILLSGQFVGEIHEDRINKMISFIDKMGA